MRLLETSIPGCFELVPEVSHDDRGRFVKTFHQDFFRQHGLVTQFAEEYYTCSRHGVLRGLHFQVPPMDHVKVVTCVAGAAMDAVVDLRAGSPSEGRHLTFELSSEKGNMLYLAPGLAHGFLVTRSEALILYKVTSAYSPAHDGGVLWDSAGIPWPLASPILSARDRGFPRLADFRSPFVW